MTAVEVVSLHRRNQASLDRRQLRWQRAQHVAGGVLMSPPLLVLYFVAQRYIMAGLSAGAIKG